MFGDRMIGTDGTVYDLYLGDSSRIPGAVNDQAWVGPQQPGQPGQPGRLAAPLPPPPTVAQILPGLRQQMTAELEAPAVEFVATDPEYGWAYVTVPFGFRVSQRGAGDGDGVGDGGSVHGVGDDHGDAGGDPLRPGRAGRPDGGVQPAGGGAGGAVRFGGPGRLLVRLRQLLGDRSERGDVRRRRRRWSTRSRMSRRRGRARSRR